MQDRERFVAEYAMARNRLRTAALSYAKLANQTYEQRAYSIDVAITELEDAARIIALLEIAAAMETVKGAVNAQETLNLWRG